MDSINEIKERYALETETYRKDHWLINFDASWFFDTFKSIVRELYPDRLAKLRILDIGAGNGMLTELMLSEFPNARITMLDFAPEMLESAKTIFEKNHISYEHIDFTVRNFITDDFPEEKYDLIISSYALHHIRRIEELERVYLKIINALKEDGTFLCLDNYLEEDKEKRKQQAALAIKKWEENYHSKEKAKEWAILLKGEDSPATVSMTLSALKKCSKKNTDAIPFLYPKRGVLAIIYGVTRLDLENIEKLSLKSYMDEIKKYEGKEKMIDSFAFEVE